MQHGLSKKYFNSYEDVKNYIDEWLSLKGRVVVLGRNPPVTKKMEKSQITMANTLIIEFIQFVI